MKIDLKRVVNSLDDVENDDGLIRRCQQRTTRTIRKGKIFKGIRSVSILSIVILYAFLIPSALFFLNKIENVFTGIVINNDIELSEKADRGNGTVENPYIIENKHISLRSQKEGERTAIVVGNTTKYLIIQHCEISTEWYGIWVGNCTNVQIIENTINKARRASIGIIYSINITVKSNIIRNTVQGIQFSLTNNSNVEYNTVTEIGLGGIWLYESNYNEINHNIVKDGIVMDYQIDDETNTKDILNAGIGIDDYSQDNHIENNLVSYHQGVGIAFFDQSNWNDVIDNNISYNGMDGICSMSSGGNTFSYNQITNNGQSDEFVGSGIDIVSCGSNTVSHNNISGNSFQGLLMCNWLSLSVNKIVYNTILNNGENGIWVWDCGYSLDPYCIHGNSIRDNGHYGIWVYQSSFESSPSLTSINSITGNDWGSIN